MCFVYENVVWRIDVCFSKRKNAKHRKQKKKNEQQKEKKRNIDMSFVFVSLHEDENEEEWEEEDKWSIQWHFLDRIKVFLSIMMTLNLPEIDRSMMMMMMMIKQPNCQNIDAGVLD